MVVFMLVMCFWHVNGCSLKNYAGRKQLHCQVGNISLLHVNLGILGPTA